MKKVCITGSEGMLGSSLAKYLSRKEDYAVIPLNRSICDLLDYPKVHSFIVNHRPDCIIHAAGRVFGIGGNSKYNWESMQENTLINFNIINAAKPVGIDKFIAIGTGAVYPSNSQSPLKESNIFDGRPHDSELGYAQAKRHMLSMLEAVDKEKDFDWAYVISCNLYGPNDSFNIENGHVIPSLIHKFFNCKKDDKAVEIWGDGSAIRDFLHVDDASALIIEIMKKVSGPINIGSNEHTSISKVVEAISKASSYDNYEYNKSFSNGAPNRYYDLSKILNLNIENEFNLDSGIKQTWKWFNENYTKARK